MRLFGVFVTSRIPLLYNCMQVPKSCTFLMNYHLSVLICFLRFLHCPLKRTSAMCCMMRPTYLPYSSMWYASAKTPYQRCCLSSLNLQMEQPFLLVVFASTSGRKLLQKNTGMLANSDSINVYGIKTVWKQGNTHAVRQLYLSVTGPVATHQWCTSAQHVHKYHSMLSNV